jgi:radical SAM superfamily enzyme YgiQ (UPF0313 family)
MGRGFMVMIVVQSTARTSIGLAHQTCQQTESSLQTKSVNTSLDAGRGCPYQCSFCTIIKVQGRKSRYRSADDCEQIVRTNVAQGIHRFFITDDNFARNKNWEAILDRMIRAARKRRFPDQLYCPGGHPLSSFD